MNTLGLIEDLLVDSFSTLTTLPQASEVGADGLRVFRTRDATPVRYSAEVVFRLGADQVEALLAYLETIRDGAMNWTGIRIFGEETGDGPLSCKLEELLDIRRNGFNDFALGAVLTLAALPTFGTPDDTALEKVPWEWSSGLQTALSHNFVRDLEGGTTVTWSGNNVRTAELSADLTREELEAVRLFRFHGAGRGVFDLTMNAPIFGETAGTDHRAQIVSFSERYSSPTLHQVRLALEKVG